MIQFTTSFHLLFLVAFVSCRIDPLHQFSTYTVIKPKYYDANQQQINFSLNNSASSTSQLVDCEKISFIKLYHNEQEVLFTFRVFVNSHFISNNYFEKYQLNGSLADDNHRKVSNDECFFRGHILHQTFFNSTLQPNANQQALALNLFRKKLNGYVSFDDKLLFIHFDENLNEEILFDNQNAKPMENEFKCGYEPSDEFRIAEHKVYKRSASTMKKIHGVYQQDTKTRFVELLIVNDHKLFLDYKRDKDRLINRSKQIANIVNTLYNPLNVFIVLVGVVVWTEEDEIEITQNGDETLNRFLKYRKEKLMPLYYNDNAQLLTNVTFKDNVVGKALKGPICTEEYSGGVNSDHNRLIEVVATTVAHELFHNFGGEHDPSDSKDPRICACPDSKCIMSPSSGSLTPRSLSNCSIESFKEIYYHGMTECLKNLPKETLSYSCGNGVLEGDEECDIGKATLEESNNKCCDKKTCKLKVNATCATGTCCDLATCQLYKLEDKKICRQSTGFCDLPEYCDGASEFCEPDVYKYNGLKCTVDGVEAYCFNGLCHSHKSQCKLLYGNSAKVSIDRCYMENSNNASQAANCGIEINKYGEKRFKACKKSDIFCGRLHCLHNSKLEYGLESASTQSMISRNGTLICQTAGIDLGVGIPDPGLVPSGVKCGEERMCLNQKCVKVLSPLCKYGCNNNGICNNVGECHCFDGFHPPYCDRLSFLTSFLLFLFLSSFVCCTIFLTYHYRERIITWWIVKQRTIAIRKRAKSTTFKLDKSKLKMRRQDQNINFDLKNLEISSPIPINNNDDAKNQTSTSQQPACTAFDYTNENLNRLWESKPESINKFVQIPNRSNIIAPVRKAPPIPNQRAAPPPRPPPNIQTNSLCNEPTNEPAKSQSVSKLKKKFEL